MDHLVFLDAKYNEIENLLLGFKTMIIRGAQSLKIPYGRVNEGDTLYFVNSKCEGEISARGKVSSVFCSGMLTVEESFETIIRNQEKLQLSDNQFEKIAGSRYLLLVGVENIEKLTPLRFELNLPAEMDDWYAVDNIEEFILSGHGIKTA
ncbi:MAG: hypothetical protein HZB98_02705 [Bacteroidia bacterium]|nr:hypothetical protein [Bacteroidia bacterium]